MKRTLALGLVILVVMGIGFGCAGNTTNNANGYNIQRYQLLGLWRDTNIEAGNMETGCPGSLTITSGRTFECGGSILFRSDSTFTQKVDRFGGTQVIREGRWTMARNLVSMYYDDVTPENARRQFTILLGEDGNSFEATEDMGSGDIIKLLLVRQVQ